MYILFSYHKNGIRSEQGGAFRDLVCLIWSKENVCAGGILYNSACLLHFRDKVCRSWSPGIGGVASGTRVCAYFSLFCQNGVKWGQ